MRLNFLLWLALGAALCRPLSALAQQAPADAAPAAPGYVLPSPDWPLVQFDQHDPLLDRPDQPQPGPFTNGELSLIFPHLRNQLRGVVFNPITRTQDTVSFPGNPVGPTVMPKLELGYRLADGWGNLLLGYRFLSTSGSDTALIGPLAGGPLIPIPPPNIAPSPASQQGRLDFDIFDLTYVTQPIAVFPGWYLRTGAGFRTLTLFFDSNVQFFDPAHAGVGGPVSQKESNSLYGFGGFGLVEVERCLWAPEWGLVGRIEGMDSYSRITQNFTQTIFAGPGSLNPVAYTRWYNGVGVSELRGMLSLSYVVPRWNYSRFLVGYQYEAFFQIGRITSFGPITTLPDDRGSLSLQGLLLRAEFNF
jgi:hypothetical protein